MFVAKRLAERNKNSPPSTPDPYHSSVPNAVNFRTASAYLTTSRVLLRDTFSLHFRLKTLQPNGLIMFAASDVAASGEWRDFIAVELINGQLRYAFNVTGVPGGRPRVVRANTGGGGGGASLSDDEWHEIGIVRPVASQHVVRVDDTARYDNVPNAGPFNLTATDSARLYIGGVPAAMYARLPRQVRARRGFQGCLGDVSLDGQLDALLSDVEIPAEHRHNVGNVCQGNTGRYYYSPY